MNPAILIQLFAPDISFPINKTKTNKIIDIKYIKVEIFFKLFNLIFLTKKVINIDKHTSRIHVDNKGLATDYPKKSEKYKQIKNEYERRLLLQLKENASSRRLFKKKTRKKYNSKTIEKKINKMPINKLQNLYYFLLHKDKSGKK